MKCIEICAGAGGQALGLEMAGFEPLALVEIEEPACQTLLMNRPQWNVIKGDLKAFSGQEWRNADVDLLAGGVPCPPFSKAGKQLGADDERDLFPEALRLVKEIGPKAVMLENVRGFLDARFEEYRHALQDSLSKMGYQSAITLLNAKDYGVPQLRPRVVIVAMKPEYWKHFAWPAPLPSLPPTVGEALYDLMASNGWEGAEAWRDMANDIAPTIVGGSKKHGGPDLGPTRAKRAWEKLGVNGKGIADEPPPRGFDGLPKLTVRMVARLQGFPDDWQFSGRKTAAYRQVGNAFPPPVAAAVAEQIKLAINASQQKEHAA